MTKAIDPLIRERTKEVKKLLEELEFVGFLDPAKIPDWTNKLTHQRAAIGDWIGVKGCLQTWLNVKYTSSRMGYVAVLGLDPKDLGDPKDRERRKEKPGKPPNDKDRK